MSRSVVLVLFSVALMVLDAAASLAPADTIRFQITSTRPTDASSRTEILVLPDGSGDQPTIQAAVDVAPIGGTILLGDGVFTGSGNHGIEIVGRALNIMSQSGDPSNCVIDCEWENYAFKFVDTVEGGRLAGVTIRHGHWERGGGVRLQSGTIRIVDCVFEECSASDRGGAIEIIGGNPTIANTVFVGNAAVNRGGGVFSLGSTPSLESCTFYGNRAGEFAGGIWVNLSTMTILNCIIAASEDGAGVHYNDGDIPQLQCCDLYGNEGGDWFGYISDQLGELAPT